MQVLIVDDERAVREALRRALELAEYRVELAPNGESALERLSVDPEPDLVILDIALPGIDGLAVMERIRQTGSDIPILALTASARAEIRYAALAAGANAFLAKPYSLDELLALVQRLATTREHDPLPPPPVAPPLADVPERGEQRPPFPPASPGRPWRRTVPIASGLVLALAALAAVLVTRGSPSPASSKRSPVLASAPQEVHALAAAPRRAVYVGTHRGLYRANARTGNLTPVGDRSFDPEALAAVSQTRLLASVHGGTAESRLARRLLESRDGGSTWRVLGSAGRGDFHAVRAAGRLLAAYDAASGRVAVSRDAGRHWRRQPFAGPLVDLALAPASPDLLATGQAQLLRSRDGGRTWAARSETTGLLAWPNRARLYLLASDGRLWLSPNQGRRWRALAAAGDRPIAFAAAAGKLYAALHNGMIKESRDGGRGWRAFAQLP